MTHMTKKTIYEFGNKNVDDLIRELKDPFNVSPEARALVDFLWNEYLTRPMKPSLSSLDQYLKAYPPTPSVVNPYNKVYTKYTGEDSLFDNRYQGAGYTLKGLMDTVDAVSSGKISN